MEYNHLSITLPNNPSNYEHKPHHVALIQVQYSYMCPMTEAKQLLFLRNLYFLNKHTGFSGPTIISSSRATLVDSEWLSLVQPLLTLYAVQRNVVFPIVQTANFEDTDMSLLEHTYDNDAIVNRYIIALHQTTLLNVSRHCPRSTLCISPNRK
eukprot:1098916-Amphidinium_carterae.1